MKKYKTTRKKRTYKKYNKAQFRSFNNKTKLNRSMKGGTFWPVFGNSKQAIESIIWKQDLRTLFQNITNDTTFEFAGSPYGTPLYKNRTKDEMIEWVTTTLHDNKKTSAEEKKELDSYMQHYYRRQSYEKAFKTSELIAETYSGNTPYSAMNNRAQKLIKNINDDKSEQKVWLQTYIKFLNNSTYFSLMQQKNIETRLKDMEQEVAQKIKPKPDVESVVKNEEDEVHTKPAVENQQDEVQSNPAV